MIGYRLLMKKSKISVEDRELVLPIPPSSDHRQKSLHFSNSLSTLGQGPAPAFRPALPFPLLPFPSSIGLQGLVVLVGQDELPLQLFQDVGRNLEYFLPREELFIDADM
jgi:hypothetical protein